MKVLLDDNYPFYLQVRKLITQKIANNDYIEDLKIPTMKQLAEEFNTNHHTVRRAVEGLVGSLLTVIRGKGIYVSSGGTKKARSIEKTLIAYEMGEIVRASRMCRLSQDEFVKQAKAEFEKQLSEEG